MITKLFLFEFGALAHVNNKERMGSVIIRGCVLGLRFNAQVMGILIEIVYKSFRKNMVVKSYLVIPHINEVFIMIGDNVYHYVRFICLHYVCFSVGDPLLELGDIFFGISEINLGSSVSSLDLTFVLATNESLLTLSTGIG